MNYRRSDLIMEGIYTQSLQNLESLRDWYNEHKANRNEATTRLHLIDKLFFECLHWERNNVENEVSTSGDYADYIFSISRKIMVVEAKREGLYFELPIKRSSTSVISLKSLCKTEKNLAKALEQVGGYCHKMGIKIGVVTNGWQLVVFVANRDDSTPPLDGNGLVFDSLDEMCNNFTELWNSISKEGIQTLQVVPKLLGEQVPDLPSKQSSKIPRYPGIQNRNPFQIDMQIISDLVLEDVVRDKDLEEEFLKECYCKSGALSEYANVSKDILNTRYRYLFEENNAQLALENAVGKKGIAKDFADILASNFSKRPILLVGDVGAGKTSFINNLTKIEAANIIRNALTFSLDLGSKAILTSDLKSTIIDELYDQLRLNYQLDIEEDSFVRGVYNIELSNFRKGINKPLYEINPNRAIEKEITFLEERVTNREQHLKKSLEHLSKGRKQQLIIFLDNCDQRNDQDQQTAFLIAQEFASQLTVVIFVSLRPETLHKSIKTGALSGYHIKAFTISPPRIDEMIEKRLRFAQKIARGEISLSIQVPATFSKLETLIEAFIQSLQTNKKLYELLENISMGNNRQAIELVKGFFGSGHVNTQKILEAFEWDGYTIPVHEFLRAIIYGDGIHYNPQSSPIVNLFDVRFYNQLNHFIRPILLGLLYSSMAGKNDGFIAVAKVYNYLQSINFLPEHIDETISFLCLKKMAESSEKGNEIDKENLPSMLRITSLGTYHITTLCSSFTYMDAIIVDTPIFDEAIRSRISLPTSIPERLNRVQILTDYLNTIWNNHLADKANSFFDWTAKFAELQKDMETVKAKNERNKERQSRTNY